MHLALIVAAGGSGSRFLEGLAPARKKALRQYPSKLFIPVAGKPVLARALEAFHGIKAVREVVLTFPPKAAREARAIARQVLREGVTLRVVAGGQTRAESVKKALRGVSKQADWILVHDGARPLISAASVRKLIREVKGWDGALLGRPVVPTLKEVRGAQNTVLQTVDRSRLYEAETPQMVKRRFLEMAFRQPGALEATDEAALLERVGARVRVVAHSDWNPKVTHMSDYEKVEAHLNSLKPEEIRTGFGTDIHRLVEGRKFYLGGIRIPAAKGPLGHSDGDALLHAITDAVLGILGAGDIGDWFSDRAKQYKNVRSEKLLGRVLEEARKEKWELQHVDTVVSLEKPRLGNYKMKIKKAIAKMTRLDPSRISIKAKSAEGLGAVGENLAIQCEAIVTARRRA